MKLDNTNKELTPYSYSFFVDNWSNIDALYGPWNGFKELIDKVTKKDNSTDVVNDFLKNKIPVGLTVAVIENDKVVEYWNPIEGQGFVKKRLSEAVSNYSTAKSIATDDNVGSIIKVNDSEVVDGITYPSGFYIVGGAGSLSRIGTSNESIMNNLESYDASDEEEKNHTYVSNVTNKDGQIYPVKKELDTDKILMSGDDEDDSDEFIEVMGTNIGGLSIGDIVRNGTSLEELLKMMLQKEIDVKIGEYPSVEITGTPVDEVYEVGTNVSGTLGCTFSSGYFVGESPEYDTKQYADCVATSYTYSPTENYNENIVYGDNKFSVIVEYSASNNNGNNPVTNMNNESSVIIESGSCDDEKIIKGEYKFWYGNLSYDYHYIFNSEITESVYNELISLTEKFTDGDNDVVINDGVVENDSNQIFCCFCPEGYELYGEQMGFISSPIKNENIYVYTLADKITKKNYNLYVWHLVGQRYTDVKLIKK